MPCKTLEAMVMKYFGMLCCMVVLTMSVCVPCYGAADQQLGALQRGLGNMGSQWPKYNMLAKPMSKTAQDNWLVFVAGLQGALEKLKSQNKQLAWYQDAKDALDKIEQLSNDLFKIISQVYATYIQPAIKNDLYKNSGIDVGFDAFYFKFATLRENAQAISDETSVITSEADDLRKNSTLFEAYAPKAAQAKTGLAPILRDAITFLYEKIDLLKQNVQEIQEL